MYNHKDRFLWMASFVLVSFFPRSFAMPTIQKVWEGPLLRILDKKDIEDILHGEYQMVALRAALWSVEYPYPIVESKTQQQAMYDLLSLAVQSKDGRMKEEVFWQLKDMQKKDRPKPWALDKSQIQELEAACGED